MPADATTPRRARSRSAAWSARRAARGRRAPRARRSSGSGRAGGTRRCRPRGARPTRRRSPWRSRAEQRDERDRADQHGDVERPRDARPAEPPARRCAAHADHAPARCRRRADGDQRRRRTARGRSPARAIPSAVTHAPTGSTHSSSWRRSAAGSNSRVTPKPATREQRARGERRRTSVGAARPCDGPARRRRRSRRGRARRTPRAARPPPRLTRRRDRRAVAALARLRHHPGQEHRVAQQVAAPHPLRLDRQSEDPFEAIVGQPARGARYASRDVVEQRADGPQRRRRRARSALRCDPELLLRASPSRRAGCPGGGR